MSIEVLRPGLLMTVQDAGRTGFRKSGVSLCGALDSFALRVANILIGNPQNTPGLEITLINSLLRFQGDSLIAICGGDLAPRVNDEPVPCWRPLFIKAGGTLHFSALLSGCRAYLAIAGGFDVPIVLGSYSTDLRARMGGYEGRALRAGDLLQCHTSRDESIMWQKRLAADSSGQDFSAPRWFISTDARPRYESKTVRVLRGSEFMNFDERSRRDFFTEEFTVTTEANRMAYRLRGCKLELSQPMEILSTAVAPGAIQVPPDGNPVLLLADCQTTGGYPVIAYIATVDLPIIAQMKPGDSLGFTEISLAEAHRLHLKREKDVAALERVAQLKMP